MNSSYLMLPRVIHYKLTAVKYGLNLLHLHFRLLAGSLTLNDFPKVLWDIMNFLRVFRMLRIFLCDVLNIVVANSDDLNMSPIWLFYFNNINIINVFNNKYIIYEKSKNLCVCVCVCVCLCVCIYMYIYIYIYIYIYMSIYMHTEREPITNC